MDVEGGKGTLGKVQAALGEERRAHLAVGKPAVLERVLVHEVSRLLQGITGQRWRWAHGATKVESSGEESIVTSIWGGAPHFFF